MSDFFFPQEMPAIVKHGLFGTPLPEPEAEIDESAYTSSIAVLDALIAASTPKPTPTAPAPVAEPIAHFGFADEDQEDRVLREGNIIHRLFHGGVASSKLEKRAAVNSKPELTYKTRFDADTLTTWREGFDAAGELQSAFVIDYGVPPLER